MFSLDDVINNSSKTLEVKRAISVKMLLQNFETKVICTSLNVSAAFVSKWKKIYQNEGPNGLRLKYKGGSGFLTAHQRCEIRLHLKEKIHYTVENLKELIKKRYGVIYQSKQSYYELLKESGLSWHRTQARNPKRNESQVQQKRKELKEKLDMHRVEIEEKEVVVFAEDECHLLWGDTVGYVWGRRNERTPVSINNIKQRQSYYGALDLYNKKFILTPHERGDGENTVAFIKNLQALHKNKKLIIIWDGAKYHDCEVVQAYLSEINQGLEEKNWKVTCLLFAPHAPDQNPVEDVWLQAKNFLRKCFYKNQIFSQVKSRFSSFFYGKKFNFSKIGWYLETSHP